MELTPREIGVLDEYLAPCLTTVGDRRPRRRRGAVGHGMVGGERPVRARIAACSPWAGRGPLR